jgi:hypothetical protein
VRWAPLAVGALFLAIALVWLGQDTRFARHGFGPGSSLSTGPEGLALARAYLAGEGREVGTLARSISRSEPPPGAVVFRVRPYLIRNGRFEREDAGAKGVHFRSLPPDGGSELADDDEDEEGEEEESLVSEAGDAGPRRLAPDGGVLAWSTPAPPGLLSADEGRFIAAGGRLVLAVDHDYGTLHVGPTSGEPVQKVFAALPGVAALEPSSPLGFHGPGLVDAVAVFERGSSPVVARRTLGKGELWLLSNPELFFNAHLAHGDNLALLVSLAGEGRPVLFDESFHGLLEPQGLLELLRRWGFGPLLCLLVLLFAVWFWRRAVTLGPPDVFRDVRSESVDLVHALARLYQRALRKEDALLLHHARLVHEVQLRLGLSPEAAAKKARELTLGWELPMGNASLSQSEFVRHLENLNRAIRRLRDERPRRA